ncbi:amino acid adenylation participated protein like [Rivularia sp. IAM M-261]|nr:amino acid adenylation participated protein like [Rivularia sp. IAM M-261]
MNLIEFVQDISIKGWRLWVEGERLCYDAPKEESTALVLAQLKQYKAKILQLLQETPEIFNVYPLSYGQKALWFLWQLAPYNYAYNVSFAVRICSEVDIVVMQKAFKALISRHPILRTNYFKLGSQPIQKVHNFQELDFLQIDAFTWSEDELKAKVVEKHQQHFDLEREPIMRVRWFTRSNFEHVLLLTIHHIACDAWSINMLIQELPQLYQAQRVGIEPFLPPLNHSYQDYVRWQRDILQGSEGERLWNYWQHKLNGDLPVLNLPTDKQRPPIQTYNGGSYQFKLSNKLIEQLNKLAQSSGATLYMILLATFELLLYRYTGQKDILVGSPTSGRTQPEFAPIFGYLVDPVVMRADLSNNPSFKEFLNQVRQTVLEALAHQDYPFALLVEKLQLPRDPSRSPIFQASFVLHQLKKFQDIQKLFIDKVENNNNENDNGNDENDIDWGGLKLRPFNIPQQEGQLDLDLEMFEDSTSIKGIFKYNIDLFDEPTIERMAGHFQNLLSAIVENPSQNVSQLPFLSESERHQLLVEWNDTATEYNSDKCIHKLFEEQVEKSLHAVAVVFEEQRLTYQQLNQKANQLAHYLQTLGVRAEVLVGICVERSIDMLVGLLGILKAGGAYVPLDPNYPPERLSYMLADSGVEVFLTQESLLETLRPHTARVICLDSDWEAIKQNAQDNLDVGVCSNNLAYVIYTSGSTGVPKGVAIEHQSPVALCHWAKQTFTAEQLSGVLAATSICFDLSVFEVFVTLCLGGKVILAKNLLDINSLDAAKEITLINTVPSVIAELLRIGDIPAQVMTVNLAGEPIQNSIVQKLYEYTNVQYVYNLYGPSEDTTYSTFTLLEKKITESPSIGRPISNTQIYILDSEIQPVSIGVPGELYIGGHGLARGYLNRQELTREKFIQNPFCDSQTERLYKTGDLARYRNNGNIEYLGRIDNQVKVRGFRIELGEIEAVLNTHPQIRQSIVIATEDNTGNKRLVAYVVKDESITSQELRQFLREKLPNYMAPSAFVILDTLPLTPNGKVDRKALPKPDGVERENECVAPRTETEKIIANIFAEVLGVKNVGIHDNFFQLGGHSLLATQLVFSVRQTFQVDLPVRYLLEEPTVTELANAIDAILQKRTYVKVIQDLNTEAVLDPAIQPHLPIKYVLKPSSIFLTGATGFLGTYLLYELLEKTSADIYCLVRSTDAQSGKQKLKNKLESYLLWNEKFSSRIIPVIGELSAKLLGLSIQQFNHLAHHIDVIYHNGAWVNHIYNYSTLKPINVLGTQEVLRLASEIKVKPVHFISTIGVFSSEAYSEIELIQESDIPDTPDTNPGLGNGYVQSKWVAEKLIIESRRRGLPVSIYRPGLIIGHSQTGISNTNDLFSRMIKGFIELGMVPITNSLLSLIPVDFVSQAIFEISLHKESLGKAFHLINPNPTGAKNMFQWIESLGYPLKEVSLEQWVSELISHPENPLHPYFFDFQSQLAQEKEPLQKYHARSNQKIDCQNTLKSLAGTDIVIPTVNAKILKTYFSYFISNGFLNVPS